METNRITFKYVGEDISNDINPCSGRKKIPMWFQQLDAVISTKNVIDSTAKMCMPFNDAIQCGYIIQSPTTIEFENKDEFNVENNDAITIERVTESKEPSDGNSKFHLPTHVLTLDWKVITPDGYSTLFLHPMNRGIDRYTSFGKLSKTDNYSQQLQVPIRVNTDDKKVKNDSITIEKGDCLYQILPLKRESILNDFDCAAFSDKKEYDSVWKSFRGFKSGLQKDVGYYRKKSRVKKPTTRVVEDDDNLSEYSPDKIDQRAELDAQKELNKLLMLSNKKDRKGMPDPFTSSEFIDEEFKKKIEKIDLIESDDMIDAMSLGAIVRVSRDITVHTTESGVEFDSSGESNGIKPMMDEQIGSGNPYLPHGSLVNFVNKWVPVVPQGYTLLFTKPINHSQSLHKSYSGIVDFDVFYTTANDPSIIKTEGTHEIPRGEPTCQLIPIKRKDLLQNAVIEE